MDAGRRATVHAGGCTSHVTHVDVHIHGGASWLYNIFDHQIEGAVRKQLEKLLCSEASKAINVDAAKALAKVKYVTPIRHTGLLDYSLLMPPLMAKGYIDTHHKGEVFWFNDHTEAPFQPRPFPESFNTSYMVTFWISDFVLNTAGLQLFRHGTLQHTLSRKDLEPKQQVFLNTTCLNQQCIGNFIPVLQDAAPHCYVIVAMNVSQPPVLRVTSGGMQGDFRGYFRFSAQHPPSNSIKYLFTIHVVADVSVVVAFKNGNVTAQVTKIAPNVTVVDTKIGGVSAKALQWTLGMLSKSFIIPQLNKVGADGLALPSTDQVQFTNSMLKLVPDALVIATDLVWNPKFHLGRDEDRSRSRDWTAARKSLRQLWDSAKRSRANQLFKMSRH